MEQVGIDGLKTGMLFSKEVVEKVVDLINKSTVENLVVDPVKIGKLDSKLLEDDAIDILKEKLLPLAKVITPHMPETSFVLNGREIRTGDDLKQAGSDVNR